MAALAVIGAAMLPMLNIQYTPSAAERRIDLYFSWPDASARLIEQSATSRIEGAMSTVAGCENVSSRSAKGYGNISVAFRKGTDMEAARFEVASAIRNLYAKLPQEISYPYISLAASGSRESETLVYTIKADLPSERIEEYVTAHGSTPLSQVEGVGRVVLSGVTPFEWVVTFDPKAMEAAGITATDLALAFRNYFRSDVVGMTTLPQADGSERSVVLKLRNRAGLDFPSRTATAASTTCAISPLHAGAKRSRRAISASTASIRSTSRWSASLTRTSFRSPLRSRRRCSAFKPPSRPNCPRR